MRDILEAEPLVLQLEIHPLGIRLDGKALEPGIAALLMRLLQVHYFPTMVMKERPKPR